MIDGEDIDVDLVLRRIDVSWVMWNSIVGNGDEIDLKNRQSVVQ
jgi:hypothetical protein